MNWTEGKLRTRLGYEPLAGLWMSIGSPAIVELAASAGADVIVLDLQHGLWDRTGMEHAIGIAAAVTSVLVRVAENTATAIGQALDAGAEGVIVPLIETAAETMRAVAAACFPPHGTRSGGGLRPLSAGFPAYVGGARTRTMVGVMIETPLGVANAAEIAATPGLDFVLIGTGDLALTLGSDNGPERHAQACASVLDTCRVAGIPCAIFTGDAAQASARLNEGYAMAIAANDISVVSQGFMDAICHMKKTESRR